MNRRLLENSSLEFEVWIISTPIVHGSEPAYKVVGTVIGPKDRSCFKMTLTLKSLFVMSTQTLNKYAKVVS